LSRSGRASAASSRSSTTRHSSHPSAMNSSAVSMYAAACARDLPEVAEPVRPVHVALGSAALPQRRRQVGQGGPVAYQQPYGVGRQFRRRQPGRVAVGEPGLELGQSGHGVHVDPGSSPTGVTRMLAPQPWNRPRSPGPRHPRPGGGRPACRSGRGPGCCRADRPAHEVGPQQRLEPGRRPLRSVPQCAGDLERHLVSSVTSAGSPSRSRGPPGRTAR
jgi:hypothetical protein